MNYEEKYKEALKVIESLYNVVRYQSSSDALFTSQTIEKAFPELRESEDEMVRKELIELVRNHARLSISGKMVAWLEKQGDYINFRNKIQVGDKVTKNEDGVLVNLSQLNRVAKSSEKSADKVEPKFKVGDWITNGEYTWKVTDIKPLDYILQSQNGEVVDDTISYVDEEFHLWTIQDAKDGDVLFTTCDNINEMVFIYRGIEFDTTHCYFLYSKTNNECKTFNSVCSVKADIHPATKEQRDLLFQKMKEVGYVWYAEKKELKKIYQEYPLTPSECFKPSWSGEDEKIYSLIYSAIKNDTQIASPSNKKDAIDWLKSLKPRWKPTEEQMEALKYFISFHEDHARSLTTKWEEFKNLESLYNDLKSL